MEIEVVKFKNKQGQWRFKAIDKETGNVIDDAQGWGFKTIQGAWKCLNWKQRSPEEKAEFQKRVKIAEKWAKETGFAGLVEAELFDCVKYGDDFKLTEKYLENFCEDENIEIPDIEFKYIKKALLG